MSFNITKPLIIIDLEMTGLNPEKHQIIELAAMYCDPLDDFKEISRFDTLVGPNIGETLEDLEYHADPVAMQVNGIPIESLEGARSPAEVMKDFQEWLPVSPYNVQLAGHGCATDYLFMEKVIKENPRTLKRFPYDFLDTKTLCRYLFAFDCIRDKYGFLSNTSLVNLAETLAIKSDGAHRAIADVEMCRKILKIFYNQVDISVKS